MTDILKVAKESVEMFGPRAQMLYALSKLADMNVELFNIFMEKADTETFISTYADFKFALLQVEIILDSSSDGAFSREVELVSNFRAEREAMRLDKLKNNIKAQNTNIVKGDITPEVQKQ